jgi:hypothetical protein
MNCPICDVHMNTYVDAAGDFCTACPVAYYPAYYIREWAGSDPYLGPFAEQHPDEPCYFFNKMCYTVSEMERLAKLKAFL